MLRDKIIDILFENAFLAALREFGDATDTVADKVYERGKNSFQICYPSGVGGNGTMRTVRSRLYDKFSRRLMQRLNE